MNLPFNVTQRQKDSREAADAGLLLWRENFGFFLLFFALPFWVCAFALRMLPEDAKYFSWLILWWLKPLFARPVLHIISVRFFEQHADFKRLFRGMGKSIRRGLFGDLLWRRFSPLRSAMMPARILEPGGKSGKEKTQRKRILKNGGLDYGFFLTLWGIALEIALLAGEILFFMIMADILAPGFLQSLEGYEVEILIYAAWCVNIILIETIYVCMGFSLYINSRINVEGWDIEILFRGFAKKLKNKKASGVLMVLCLVFLFFPVKTFAAENDVPMEALQNILASPEYGGEQDSWGIRLKKPLEFGETPEFNPSPHLEKLRTIFAFILRFILIVLISVLLVFLFLYVRKLRFGKVPKEKESITILHGIPSGNPERLLEKAHDFFEQGNLRLAWGYCTAAAIFSWQLYRGLVFPPNATESDCADIVSQSPCSRDEDKIFRVLINYWINFAYAGRLPLAGSFEEASAFCKSLLPLREESSRGEPV